MIGWIKAMAAVAVAVVPGAFLLLVAYACGRAVRESWKVQKVQAGPGPVPMREVLAAVRFADVMRHARSVI